MDGIIRGSVNIINFEKEAAKFWPMETRQKRLVTGIEFVASQSEKAGNEMLQLLYTVH